MLAVLGGCCQQRTCRGSRSRQSEVSNLGFPRESTGQLCASGLATPTLTGHVTLELTSAFSPPRSTQHKRTSNLTPRQSIRSCTFCIPFRVVHITFNRLPDIRILTGLSVWLAQHEAAKWSWQADLDAHAHRQHSRRERFHVKKRLLAAITLEHDLSNVPEIIPPLCHSLSVNTALNGARSWTVSAESRAISKTYSLKIFVDERLTRKTFHQGTSAPGSYSYNCPIFHQLSSRYKGST